MCKHFTFDSQSALVLPPVLANSAKDIHDSLSNIGISPFYIEADLLRVGWVARSLTAKDVNKTRYLVEDLYTMC